MENTMVNPSSPEIYLARMIGGMLKVAVLVALLQPYIYLDRSMVVYVAILYVIGDVIAWYVSRERARGRRRMIRKWQERER